jgi:hypothetical protein
MRVLVCVKRVPAPGARINITADGQAVDTAFLGFTMSPHEECAVEEAVQLIERHGGDSTVLTLGPAEADEQLLVRGPGIAPGTTSELPVTLVDLPATFAAIAGASPSWPVDGTSVVPTLRGLDQPFRDTVLVQTGDDGGDGWAYRGVRTDRYLYGVNGADSFLYDDDLDPDQLVNRIDDPAYAAVRAALEQRRSHLITCAGRVCNQTFGALPEPG